MKKNHFEVLKKIFLITLVVLSTGCGDDDKKVKETIISSDFVSGVDDWKIEGDAKGSEGVIPNFSEINGVGNSGYIYAKDDATGGTWYFIAPSKYHGNKSEFFNGKLEFYLIQDSNMANQFKDDDLIIDGVSGKKILYNHDNYPNKTWTKYQINLNSDSQWVNENGDIASDEEIKNVLSNITKIMLRGEFEDGEDTGGLDGFKFLN